MRGSNIYGVEDAKDIVELISENTMCVIVNSDCEEKFEFGHGKLDYNVIRKERF